MTEYAIRESQTGKLWRCPGATLTECAMTAWLWASWGIECLVEPGNRRANSGYARAAALSPARRSEIARAAAKKRWAR